MSEFRRWWGSGQRWSAAIAATAALVLLAGCSDGGKNAPLPRASKARTRGRAEGIGRGLASVVGSSVRTNTRDTAFDTCTGEQGEQATDARYFYTYYAYIPVPTARQPAAARAMTAYLKARGYRAVGSLPSGDARLGLPLDTVRGGWSVSLDAVTVTKGASAPDTIGVSVFSPCYLPPGAVQKAQD